MVVVLVALAEVYLEGNDRTNFCKQLIPLLLAAICSQHILYFALAMRNGFKEERGEQFIAERSALILL